VIEDERGIVTNLSVFGTIKRESFIYFEVILIRLVLTGLKETINLMVYSRIYVQLVDDS
jgi:hypothetical protein